jgi:hypothetical protein
MMPFSTDLDCQYSRLAQEGGTIGVNSTHVLFNEEAVKFETMDEWVAMMPTSSSNISFMYYLFKMSSSHKWFRW